MNWKPSNWANLVIPIYAVHRHPAFWDEPERFDPERFREEKAAGRHRFAYFPFGGGPRQCIGNAFALMEARLILAMIVQRYRLRLESGTRVILEPLVTLATGHAVHAQRTAHDAGTAARAQQ